MSKPTLNIPDSLTNLTNIDYQILDAIEASIYWKDLNGRYLGANKYMLNMAGITREELIGNTDYFLPWRMHINRIREVDELVITNKKRYDLEELAQTIEGDDKVFLSSKSPLFDDNGNVIGIIGISFDITHSKKFENEFAKTEKSLSEYSNIKTRFLRNVSHEARIPMGSVLSIADSLHSNWDKLDDKLKKENIDLIFKESSRLSRFILNTFDMSSFIKSEIQPRFSKNNLSQLVKDVVENYKKSFSEEKIEIKVSDFDDYILAFDKKLITQVVENLLMNAVQYSPKKKKITITIHKSHLKDGAVPAVHCCITDEGIGIPEAELQSIFDSFTESSATASKACGVGLGLSICKEIIDLHSGKIWAENNSLKQGATFNFCIPTTLFSFSTSEDDKQELDNKADRITFKEISKTYPNSKKKPFALIVISPFNSYFSSEKIFEICQWINDYYEDFAIFFPNKISKYTLGALSTDEVKTKQKVQKQDNHVINRINNALEMFYDACPEKSEIKLYTISELKENSNYQNLHLMYMEMFFNDKEFRKECLGLTKGVLSNNAAKQKAELNEYQEVISSYTGVQYFLSELPVMLNMARILKIKSCDSVYHDLPKNLKSILCNADFNTESQGFLVLK